MSNIITVDIPPHSIFPPDDYFIYDDFPSSDLLLETAKGVRRIIVVHLTKENRVYMEAVFSEISNFDSSSLDILLNRIFLWCYQSEITGEDLPDAGAIPQSVYLNLLEDGKGEGHFLRAYLPQIPENTTFKAFVSPVERSEFPAGFPHSTFRV